MDWRILLLENFFIFASVVVHVVIEQTRTDENKLSTNIVVQKKITAYSTKSRCSKLREKVLLNCIYSLDCLHKYIYIYTRIYYYDCYQINSIFYDDICVVYACLKTVSRRVVFFVEYGLDMATADVDAAIS